jgi:hypothetical protein
MGTFRESAIKITHPQTGAMIFEIKPDGSGWRNGKQVF